MKRLCISIDVLPDYFDLKNKESVAEYFGHDLKSKEYLSYYFLYKEKNYCIFSQNHDKDDKETTYTLFSPSLDPGMELNFDESNLIDKKDHDELVESYENNIKDLKEKLETQSKELEFHYTENSKPKIDKDLVLELISAANGNKLK